MINKRQKTGQLNGGKNVKLGLKMSGIVDVWREKKIAEDLISVKTWSIYEAHNPYKNSFRRLSNHFRAGQLGWTNF